MKDQRKTKQQLLAELEELRRRVAPSPLRRLASRVTPGAAANSRAVR